MEKYQLIFSGERCGSFAKLPIREHLKLLKLSDSACEKVVSGSNVVLKSGLDELAMQQQKALFVKRGLVTKHRLALSPEIFHAGLAPLNDLDVSNDLSVILLKKENEPTQILSRPSDTTLYNIKNQGPISVAYLNHQIGFMVLMVLAALSSLLLLTPVVMVVQSITSYSPIASLCGVLFLTASVLMLPRLYQPLQVTTIKKGSDQIELFDQVSLMVGKKKLDWRHADKHGSFKIASAKAEAHSNRPMYSWNAHHRLEDTGGAAIDDIHSAITQGTIIEIIESIWKKLEPIFTRKPAGVKALDIDWECEPASAVFNTRNEVVALIYRQNQKAYKIVRTELVEDIILHAFCLSIHKGGLA